MQPVQLYYANSIIYLTEPTFNYLASKNIFHKEFTELEAKYTEC
jgi:hypothetical protein